MRELYSCNMFLYDLFKNTEIKGMIGEEIFNLLKNNFLF